MVKRTKIKRKAKARRKKTAAAKAITRKKAATVRKTKSTRKNHQKGRLSGEHHPRRPSFPRRLRLSRRQSAHRHSLKQSGQRRPLLRNPLRQRSRGSVSAS
jgi:hypothetical protein